MEREVERTARFVRRPVAARAGGFRSYLIVIEGKEHGARLEPTSERQVVGRGAGSALRLSDPGVSSVHLAAWLEGDALWIEDLGSSNGTAVDGQVIDAPAELEVGAIVAIGKTLLRHEKRDPEELTREIALEEDLSKAASYVAAILPPPMTDGPVRVAWRYLPSERLGGDVFGYRWLDDSRFAFFLLDIAGHGIPSALHAVSAANAIRSGQVGGADPGSPTATLGALNAAFQMERHGGMYLTAWYGVFDRRSRVLRYSSGGHPAPLVKLTDPAGGPPRIDRLTCRNPPIGMAPALVYSGVERTLPPGSRLYLFSDGVFEIASDEGRQWGYDDLAEIVARHSIPGFSELARIETDVRASLPGTRFDDDFSLLVVELD